MNSVPPSHAEAALANVVVVLDEPKDVVNVAGVIRAMMNMGLGRLRLVRPPRLDAVRVAGIAHRGEPVLEASEIFDTLEESVADAHLVIGTSARARTAQRNYARPREGAQSVVERAREGHTVAVLLGREDRGLTNDALDRCDRVVVIPTDEEHSSLNLAQACLVLCYEIFLAAGRDRNPLPTGRRATRRATRAEEEEMYDALHGGLTRIEFYKSRHPVSVLRTLRTVLSRADLDLRESRLFRAIGFEIGHYLDRTRPS